MDHLIGLLTAAVLFIFGIGLAIVTTVDNFLGHQMALEGMPPALQTLVLIVVIAFVLVGIVRLLGGPLMWLLIVLLVLLILHRTMPGEWPAPPHPFLSHPNAPPPPAQGAQPDGVHV